MRRLDAAILWLMDSNETWFRRAIKFLGDLRNILFGAGIVAAIFGPIAVTIMGYVEGVPRAYIVVLATAMVAFGIVIADRIAAWIARTRGDYAYTLAYEGVYFGFDEGNPDHILQVGINLRNMCAHPSSYRVRRFDVVIGTRTLPNPRFDSTGGFIPRGASRRYTYPSFPRSTVEEFLGKQIDGSITMEIEYGYPDRRAVRLLTMKIAIMMKLREPVACLDSIISERDSRL